MNANLIIKGKKVQLTGNKLSGDTYPIKSFIKDYLWGEWDAQTKSWIVDEKRIEKYLEVGRISINKESSYSNKSSKVNNGYCPICHTYCYGDCQG